MTGSGKFSGASMIVIAAVLAACAAPPNAPERASAGYSWGYTEGCDSGYTEAFRDGYSLRYGKDEARFEADPEYRRGWEDGYAYCYEDEWRQPLMLPSGRSG